MQILWHSEGERGKIIRKIEKGLNHLAYFDDIFFFFDSSVTIFFLGFLLKEKKREPYVDDILGH